MSYLSLFEFYIERFLEGTIRRWIKKPLSESDVQRRLERTMEANQVVVGSNTVVPHNYKIYLSPGDYHAIAKPDYLPPKTGKPQSDVQQAESKNFAVCHRLAYYLTQLAHSRGFVTPHPIRVSIERGNPLPLGELLIIVNDLNNDATADMQAIGTDVHPDPTTRTGNTNVTQDSGSLEHVRGSRYQVVVQSTSGKSQAIPITQTHFTIGRMYDNNLTLQDGQVSRQHARISFQARRFQIEDLDSHNGTFVNGERLGSQAYILDITHDVITISHYTIRIQPIP